METKGSFLSGMRIWVMPPAKPPKPEEMLAEGGDFRMVSGGEIN